jgi:hypothetical protein
MRYAKADIDLKRQALAQVFQENLAPPAGGRVRLDRQRVFAPVAAAVSQKFF